MTTPDSLARDDQSAPADPPPEPPRVRLLDVRVHRATSGRVRVEVDVASPEGLRVTGACEDVASVAGDVRVAAEAAIAALHSALPAAPRFEVAGAKTVRAFDQTVTLVLVGILGGAGPARLLGAACNEEDVARAAVLAVLNATNRVRAPGVAAGMAIAAGVV